MTEQTKREEFATEQELAEIEKALSQASQWPWEAYDDEDGYTWQLFGGNNGCKQLIKAPKKSEEYMEYWPDPEDAKIIENAPAWLDKLAKECRRLKKENERLKEALKENA